MNGLIDVVMKQSQPHGTSLITVKADLLCIQLWSVYGNELNFSVPGKMFTVLLLKHRRCILYHFKYSCFEWVNTLMTNIWSSRAQTCTQAHIDKHTSRETLVCSQSVTFFEDYRATTQESDTRPLMKLNTHTHTHTHTRTHSLIHSLSHLHCQYTFIMFHWSSNRRILVLSTKSYKLLTI